MLKFFSSFCFWGVISVLYQVISAVDTTTRVRSVDVGGVIPARRIAIGGIIVDGANHPPSVRVGIVEVRHTGVKSVTSRWTRTVSSISNGVKFLSSIFKVTRPDTVNTLTSILTRVRVI